MTHVSDRPSPLARRLRQLDVMLQEHADLWRPQPYKTLYPAWCTTYRQLTIDLLSLEDAQVDLLMADAQALMAFLAREVPGLARFTSLIEVPQSRSSPLAPAGARYALDVPGRKAAQIEAFAAALGAPLAPVSEWCAGKGHLGRRLALGHGAMVDSLDVDPRLCEAGRMLARRAGAANQHFVTGDVLSPLAGGRLRGRHAVALHACGELHTALLRRVADDGAVAVHLAPCCYHKTTESTCAALSGEGSLQLTSDDLRLAVSDAVTAKPREIQAGRLEAAWILGLRAMFGGERLSMRLPALRNICKPRRADFRAFCERAAELCGLSLAAAIDWAQAERNAIALEHRVRRLALPRLAFRRALELWLVFDRARFLEQSGFRVSVSTFCPRRLTPRNLLIAAQR